MRRVLLPLAGAFALVAGALFATPASAATSTHSNVKWVCAEAAAGSHTMPCFALLRTDLKAGQRQRDQHPTRPRPATARPTSSARTSCRPAGGAGETVAIVDAYDDPTAEADLATYRSQYGLPACTTANGCFRKVNQNGVHEPAARQRHRLGR